MTPAGQRWTRSTPTEPGWYWFNEQDSVHGQEVVHILPWPNENQPQFLIARFASGRRGKVTDLCGEWQGPLTPNEATE